MAESAQSAQSANSPPQQGTSPNTANPAGQVPSPSDDPRYGYRHIRYSFNERERTLQEQRANDRWQHARPNSVFVAAMGNHWAPGSWQAVMDMIDYTNKFGYFCAFEEIMDRCFQPYDNLGSMRNEAIMKAMAGYDWLLYLDNDVYPPPHAIVQMIQRERSIIAPYIVEPATGRQLHGPVVQPWTGVQLVRWCVLSMLIFRTGVFNATGVEFWNNGIGSDEGYHFQKTAHYGHFPHIDTELQVRVAYNPTYPLATLRMQKPDAEKFWDDRRKRFLDAPNRAPLDPNDRRISNLGEYLPFIQPQPVPVVVPETPGTVTTASGLAVPASAVNASKAGNGHEHMDEIAALAGAIGGER